MIQTLVNSWWAFILLGVCAGIISGTLGIGSGTLFIPVLVLLFHLPQKTAQGTALAVMIPMALVGAIRYKMNPDIEINMLWVSLLAIGAVAGALVGVELAKHLPGSMLRKIFAIYIIIVGVRMLWPVSKSKKPADKDSSAVTQLQKSHLKWR